MNRELDKLSINYSYGVCFLAYKDFRFYRALYFLSISNNHVKSGINRECYDNANVDI